MKLIITDKWLKSKIENSDMEESCEAGFRPTTERLKELCDQSRIFLENATEEQLGDFHE